LQPFSRRPSAGGIGQDRPYREVADSGRSTAPPSMAVVELAKSDFDAVLFGDVNGLW